MPQPAGEVEALLDLLYSAATNPASWPEFLALAARVFDACIAGLIHQAPGHPNYTTAASIGLDEKAVQLYNEHFSTLDPWYLALQHAGTKQWIGAGSDLCGPLAFGDSEYYNDFWRKHTQAWYQGGFVHQIAGVSSVFTLHRTRTRGDFDHEDLALFRDLLPHLRRALSVHRTVVDLRASVAQVSGAVDALDIGLAALGEDRKIRFANAQAESLFRAGDLITSRDGRLVTQHPAAEASLAELVKKAFGRSLGSPAGGALELSDGGGRLLLAVLPSNAYLAIAPGPPAALLLIVDPDARPQSRERLLSVLFRLTPSESRVVMLLLQGLEPKEIAQRTRTTAGTVRFQLKRVYQKTGVSRQSQLVRLVSRIPGIA